LTGGVDGVAFVRAWKKGRRRAESAREEEAGEERGRTVGLEVGGGSSALDAHVSAAAVRASRTRGSIVLTPLELPSVLVVVEVNGLSSSVVDEVLTDRLIWVVGEVDAPRLSSRDAGAGVGESGGSGRSDRVGLRVGSGECESRGEGKSGSEGEELHSGRWK
jgi:hypothetical protein